MLLLKQKEIYGSSMRSSYHVYTYKYSLGFNLEFEALYELRGVTGGVIRTGTNS